MEKTVIIKGQSPDDVKLVDHFGDDLRIWRAARMSFGACDVPVSTMRHAFFIGELLKNGHFVPFEHCLITYYLRAPIFVFRQLFRYRTAVISEKSLRYCEANPEFYAPDPTDTVYIASLQRSFDDYRLAVEGGMKKEQARGLLPFSVFSAALFTINLRNLFHLWDQRIDDHAQAETRYLAERMLAEAEMVFPLAVGAYKGLRKVQKMGNAGNSDVLL